MEKRKLFFLEHFLLSESSLRVIYHATKLHLFVEKGFMQEGQAHHGLCWGDNSV